VAEVVDILQIWLTEDLEMWMTFSEMGNLN